jgi:hypothetical protein
MARQDRRIHTERCKLALQSVKFRIGKSALDRDNP